MNRGRAGERRTDVRAATAGNTVGRNLEVPRSRTAQAGGKTRAVRRLRTEEGNSYPRA